ncbi:MAG: rod shape-determining protein MreC [Gaiellaceae bacterium]|nr:rod shape-determining protein MreC [Gaiellaceae bacterium]
MGLLVLLSLVLITVSFRSSALDGAQGTAAGILRPFEIAADRISRPFRDAVGYSRGLVDAKAENAKLRRQIQSLQQQLIVDEGAVQQNVQLEDQLGYHGLPTIANFRKVSAAVQTNPQNIDQSVTIAVGSDEGVRPGSVVLSSRGGLAGIVDRAFAHVAHVTLLTDNQSAVTALDLTSPGAVGIIQPGGGGSDVLVLDLVSKKQVMREGDTIITAGSLGKGKFPSMFPGGIPIGTVTSQSSNDVNPFKNVQVKPLVDFSSLQSVIVLVPKR